MRRSVEACVTAADYKEVFVPALREKIDAGAEIRSLYVRKSFSAFAWMIPGEAKLFGESELEDAKAWVAG